MKIKNGFAKREIAGSYIVVPVGKEASEFNGMITLNESGSFFWDCLQNDTTFDGAIEKITSEYNVEKSRAEEDLKKFITMLKENNLLDE